MFAYIVRRLLWAVVLLIVLSMVTFSIFYLVPRLGGATPETLAARYVGRAATAETVHLTAEKLGLLDPVPVQYWHWLKGIFVGASMTTAQVWSIVRRLVSGTPSSRSSRCGPSCSTARR